MVPLSRASDGQRSEPGLTGCALLARGQQQHHYHLVVQRGPNQIRAAQPHRGKGPVELLRTSHDAMGKERPVDRVVAALDRLADEYHRFILERPREYGESYPSRLGRQLRCSPHLHLEGSAAVGGRLPQLTKLRLGSLSPLL